jgi:hypothetical protein
MCIHVSQQQLHSAVVIDDQNHIFSKHYSLKFNVQYNALPDIA